MANLSFGIKGTGMDFVVAVEVADADASRILSYLASTEYGTVTEDGVSRPAPIDEVVRSFSLGILQGLLDQTVRFEKDQAVKIASEAIQNIEIK